jgi:hypothetical protein
LTSYQAAGTGVEVALDKAVDLAPSQVESRSRCAGFDLAGDNRLDRFEPIKLLHRHGDGLGLWHTELQWNLEASVCSL